ncbi:tRNA (adenosine(37)-N6)-threonylcarbamoyltransferase complex dimerization subunit type 1 TsaB [Flavobacterium sp. CYK-4]|uniref:tRNA (adenosine(37)-N6)-threonylcarbamoyltransferase complex dimerization subunit type 1 TsaB n=1 Tax=Flavobacterium lotistagni TaxID=2709660 RepID=UPI00140D78E7|nr:tRNA (adenosine(37)-N6)-threonylcarbamoyltransferase complex dimerization subunit type 1 TsaB [Flavobacterium lotistagni]NHM06776.1 tRNA (adenosine(37)-N6)-threonylcarbamoyltransferase complex dimerization subunit type 1 TsaB [Flavobacterium lotistagni]
MALILNIETSTKNCSVSISQNGQTLLCKEVAESGYSHAEKLHVFIEELLLGLQLNYKDLNAIAVSQGPGSYTGLRIGVSAAKGLCYALNIPLITVDTLEVLARRIQVSEGFIIPMIDARRMEAYTAVFNSNYEKVRETQAQIIEANSFETLSGSIYLLGDGASKCREILNQEDLHFKDDILYPSASEMALLSYAKFQQNDFVDVAYFEPYYLKDFMTTTPKK